MKKEYDRFSEFRRKRMTDRKIKRNSKRMNFQIKDKALYNMMCDYAEKHHIFLTDLTEEAFSLFLDLSKYNEELHKISNRKKITVNFVDEDIKYMKSQAVEEFIENFWKNNDYTDEEKEQNKVCEKIMKEMEEKQRVLTHVEAMELIRRAEEKQSNYVCVLEKENHGKLKELRSRTGKNLKTLVNEAVDLYLDLYVENMQLKEIAVKTGNQFNYKEYISMIRKISIGMYISQFHEYEREQNEIETLGTTMDRKKKFNFSFDPLVKSQFLID